MIALLLLAGGSGALQSDAGGDGAGGSITVDADDATRSPQRSDAQDHTLVVSLSSAAAAAAVVVGAVVVAVVVARRRRVSTPVVTAASACGSRAPSLILPASVDAPVGGKRHQARTAAIASASVHGRARDAAGDPHDRHSRAADARRFQAVNVEDMGVQLTSQLTSRSSRKQHQLSLPSRPRALHSDDRAAGGAGGATAQTDAQTDAQARGQVVVPRSEAGRRSLLAKDSERKRRRRRGNRRHTTSTQRVPQTSSAAAPEQYHL